MTKNYSKGTPDQFLNEVKDRIYELSEDTYEITSSIDNLDADMTDSVNIKDYAESLGTEVVDILSDEGYDATSTVDRNCLKIAIYEGLDSLDIYTYLQPLADIIPDGDLHSDAEDMVMAIELELDRMARQSGEGHEITSSTKGTDTNIKILYKWTYDYNESEPDNGFLAETDYIVTDGVYGFGDYLLDRGVQFENEDDIYYVVDDDGDRTGEAFMIVGESATNEEISASDDLDTDRYFHSLMKSFKSNNKNIKYFNVGDRVREKYANPYRIGTILDIYDNGDVKVEWDYSDGDDIEIIEKHLIELYEMDHKTNIKESTCNCGKDYDYMVHDTISASDDLDTDRYIHSLIGEVESKLVNEVDGIKWDQDDENLYMTITYGDVIIEEEIPFEDLDMIFANLEDDAAYIVNTVLYDLDNIRIGGSSV